MRPTTSQVCIGPIVWSSFCQTTSFFLEEWWCKVGRLDSRASFLFVWGNIFDHAENIWDLNSPPHVVDYIASEGVVVVRDR